MAHHQGWSTKEPSVFISRKRSVDLNNVLLMSFFMDLFGMIPLTQIFFLQN